LFRSLTVFSLWAVGFTFIASSYSTATPNCQHVVRSDGSSEEGDHSVRDEPVQFAGNSAGIPARGPGGSGMPGGELRGSAGAFDSSIPKAFVRSRSFWPPNGNMSGGSGRFGLRRGDASRKMAWLRSPKKLFLPSNWETSARPKAIVPIGQEPLKRQFRIRPSGPETPHRRIRNHPSGLESPD
jgi:hypothetical protein